MPFSQLKGTALRTLEAEKASNPIQSNPIQSNNLLDRIKSNRSLSCAVLPVKLQSIHVYFRLTCPLQPLLPLLLLPVLLLLVTPYPNSLWLAFSGSFCYLHTSPESSTLWLTSSGSFAAMRCDAPPPTTTNNDNTTNNNNNDATLGIWQIKTLNPIL